MSAPEKPSLKSVSESEDPVLTPGSASLRPGGLFAGERDENGVDLSLLRYLQGLSPWERLILMERHARDTRLLYEYGRKHREATTGQNR